MGAIRIRDQTADKNNPQVIHMTPVHQLTFCEVKSCMFVRNKSFIKAFFLNFKPLLPAKSPFFIILLFPVKKLSRLNQERIMHQIKHIKHIKTVLNIDVGKFSWLFHWRKQNNRLSTQISAKSSSLNLKLLKGVNGCPFSTSWYDSLGS